MENVNFSAGVFLFSFRDIMFGRPPQQVHSLNSDGHVVFNNHCLHFVSSVTVSESFSVSVQESSSVPVNELSSVTVKILFSVSVRDLLSVLFEVSRNHPLTVPWYLSRCHPPYQTGNHPTYCLRILKRLC